LTTATQQLFNTVAETGNGVAKNRKYFEATFDFVKRTKFYNKLCIFFSYFFFSQLSFLKN